MARIFRRSKTPGQHYSCQGFKRATPDRSLSATRSVPGIDLAVTASSVPGTKVAVVARSVPGMKLADIARTMPGMNIAEYKKRAKELVWFLQ